MTDDEHEKAMANAMAGVHAIFEKYGLIEPPKKRHPIHRFVRQARWVFGLYWNDIR